MYLIWGIASSDICPVFFHIFCYFVAKGVYVSTWPSVCISRKLALRCNIKAFSHGTSLRCIAYVLFIQNLIQMELTDAFNSLTVDSYFLYFMQEMRNPVQIYLDSYKYLWSLQHGNALFMSNLITPIYLCKSAWPIKSL